MLSDWRRYVNGTLGHDYWALEIRGTPIASGRYYADEKDNLS